MNNNRIYTVLVPKKGDDEKKLLKALKKHKKDVKSIEVTKYHKLALGITARYYILVCEEEVFEEITKEIGGYQMF